MEPLTDYGAVHDKPDDKLKLIKYESMYSQQTAGSAKLLTVGAGCGPGLREEEPAARPIAATPKKQSEATGIILEKSKAGRWPCFVFDMGCLSTERSDI